MKNIRKFATAAEKEAATLAYPNVNWVVSGDTLSIEASAPYVPPTPEPPNYLSFRPDYQTKFGWEDVDEVGNSVQYSMDDGETWETLNSNEQVTVPARTTILWKGNCEAGDYASIGKFTAEFDDECPEPMPEEPECYATFSVQGNIMSLIYGDNITGHDEFPANADKMFYELFAETPVQYAGGLVLPATTATTQCYSFMFRDCSHLLDMPELPATTLAGGCYMGMFNNCSQLSEEWYVNTLSAETLVNGCYNNMFAGCSNLGSVTILATDMTANDCLSDWLFDAGSEKGGGTVYAPAGAVFPEYTIPDDWTVEVVADEE